MSPPANRNGRQKVGFVSGSAGSTGALLSGAPDYRFAVDSDWNETSFDRSETEMKRALAVLAACSAIAGQGAAYRFVIARLQPGIMTFANLSITAAVAVEANPF